MHIPCAVGIVHGDQKNIRQNAEVGLKPFFESISIVQRRVQLLKGRGGAASAWKSVSLADSRAADTGSVRSPWQSEATSPLQHSTSETLA